MAESGGIQLRTLDDAFRFSRMVIAAGMAPKGFERPETIVLAIQAGLELGIAPMQSLRWAMVVNNRPSWFGDMPLMLARRSGRFDEAAFLERWEGQPYSDNYRAVCRVRRLPDGEVKEYAFSVAQAKTARLWKKSGPWSDYPDRMLQMRARGFALRDQFGDALGGLDIAEEQWGARPANVVGDSVVVEQVPSDLDGLAAALRDEPPPAPAEEPTPAVKKRRRELRRQADELQASEGVHDEVAEPAQQTMAVDELEDVGEEPPSEVDGDEGLDEREPGDDGEDLI